MVLCILVQVLLLNNNNNDDDDDNNKSVYLKLGNAEIVSFQFPNA